MLPMDGHDRWMFAMKKMLLFYGIYLSNHIFVNEVFTDETCKPKDTLYISLVAVTQKYFPSDIVYQEENGTKLCFNIQPDNKTADCCNISNFNCSIQVTQGKNGYIANLTEDIFSKQDIVVMTEPQHNYSCMPSQLYSKSGTTQSSFLLNIQNCLNESNINVRLNGTDCLKNPTRGNTLNCQGVNETQYIIFENNTCMSCKKPYSDSLDTSINLPLYSVPTTADKANDVMQNLAHIVEKMGNSSTAALKIGPIVGLIAKLPKENQTDMNFAFTEKAEVTNLFGQSSNSLTGSFRSISIPKEASAMAVKKNGSFLGILLFPGMKIVNTNKYYYNNEIMGIEMGAEVANLSQAINIQFSNVSKKGANASCMSWDGTSKGAGGNPLWITDGCQMIDTNTSIICQCSHLTFFAILMSPPHDISAADVSSLTYITSVGCGLSLFFMVLGLFMHALVRKGKASQATKILMNLFVAMVVLNLSFLTNESIAKLQNPGACVAIAAVLHYGMLASFTWFFMQALHLFLSLHRICTEVKHYMLKICITGWVIPAVVVIALLATHKYDSINITTNNGTSATMCWISDAVIHQGVNVGYYAVVFVFTLTVFVITVRQIALLSKTETEQRKRSIKTNTCTIVGLLLLLGITWAFAFFSYGSLVIVSYYIFTILNSFQGFFLFIYYYHSSKIIGIDKMHVQNSSSIATSNTTVKNAYG